MCAEILPLAMPTLVQFGSTVHVQVRARGYTPKMGKGEGSIKSITWLGGGGGLEKDVECIVTCI